MELEKTTMQRQERDVQGGKSQFGQKQWKWAHAAETSRDSAAFLQGRSFKRSAAQFGHAQSTRALIARCLAIGAHLCVKPEKGVSCPHAMRMQESDCVPSWQEGPPLPVPVEAVGLLRLETEISSSLPSGSTQELPSNPPSPTRWLPQKGF